MNYAGGARPALHLNLSSFTVQAVNTSAAFSGDSASAARVSGPANGGALAPADGIFRTVKKLSNDSHALEFDAGTGNIVTQITINDNQVNILNEKPENDEPEYLYHEPLLEEPLRDHPYNYVAWYEDASHQKVILKINQIGSDLKIMAEAPQRFKITWLNEDETELYSASFEKGANLTYGGETPTKASTEALIYNFAGWSPEMAVTVTESATYTATFTSDTREYTITWKNYNDSTITTTKVGYNIVPSYPAGTFGEPSKPSDTSKHYKFSGWNPQIVAVTGDASYTAQFTSINRIYIYWMGDKFLTATEVEYGETPSYTGSKTPSKASANGIRYEFNNGWTPQIVPATTNTYYYATFDEFYMINWYNYDGETLLYSNEFKNGTELVYGGTTPTKAPTHDYYYEFAGWNPAMSDTATEPANFVARFTSVARVYYTITWRSAGSVIKTDSDIESGTVLTPIPPEQSELVVPSREHYAYTFSGWTPNVESVTVNNNLEYVAQFTEAKVKYEITWRNGDGEVITTTEVEYDTLPIYPIDQFGTPTKTSTAQFNYTFNNWNNTIVTATGAATYTAAFNEILREYTITWKNYDTSTITITEVAYGTLPVYSGETPTKAGNDEFNYTFSGWSPEIVNVTGAATYTATFSAIPVDIPGEPIVIEAEIVEEGSFLTVVLASPENYTYSWKKQGADNSWIDLEETSNTLEFTKEKTSVTYTCTVYSGEEVVKVLEYTVPGEGEPNNLPFIIGMGVSALVLVGFLLVLLALLARRKRNKRERTKV